MVTSKTSYLCGDPTSDLNVHFVPGSLHDIPWDRVMFYLSPREAEFLRTQFTRVECSSVSVSVTNFGVRLPFETNASKTSIANVNAKVPIVDYFNIDEHHTTYTAGSSIKALLQKCVGNPIVSTHSKAVGATDTFDNISAMVESRKFENPLHFLLPYLLRQDTADARKVIPSFMSIPNEPLLTTYMQSVIDGSTFMGPCFHHEYKPKHGLLWSRCTNLSMGNETYPEHYYGVSTLPSKHLTNINASYMPQLKGYRTAFNDDAYITRIENELVVDPLNPDRRAGRVPRFAIGMYNLRNTTESSIVDAVWEFAIDARIEGVATSGASGIYQRLNVINPEAEHMYPLLRPGGFTETIQVTDDNRRTLYNRPTVECVKNIPNQHIGVDSYDMFNYPRSKLVPFKKSTLTDTFDATMQGDDQSVIASSSLSTKEKVIERKSITKNPILDEMFNLWPKPNVDAQGEITLIESSGELSTMLETTPVERAGMVHSTPMKVDETLKRKADSSPEYVDPKKTNIIVKEGEKRKGEKKGNGTPSNIVDDVLKEVREKLKDVAAEKVSGYAGTVVSGVVDAAKSAVSTAVGTGIGGVVGLTAGAVSGTALGVLGSGAAAARTPTVPIVKAPATVSPPVAPPVTTTPSKPIKAKSTTTTPSTSRTRTSTASAKTPSAGKPTTATSTSGIPYPLPPPKAPFNAIYPPIRADLSVPGRYNYIVTHSTPEQLVWVRKAHDDFGDQHKAARYIIHLYENEWKLTYPGTVE